MNVVEACDVKNWSPAAAVAAAEEEEHQHRTRCWTYYGILLLPSSGGSCSQIAMMIEKAIPRKLE